MLVCAVLHYGIDILYTVHIKSEKKKSFLIKMKRKHNKNTN